MNIDPNSPRISTVEFKHTHDKIEVDENLVINTQLINILPIEAELAPINATVDTIDPIATKTSAKLTPCSNAILLSPRKPRPHSDIFMKRRLRFSESDRNLNAPKKKSEMISGEMIKPLNLRLIKEELTSEGPILIRNRSASSSQISIAKIHKVESVWSRFQSLANLLTKIEEKQAIIIGSDSIFRTKKITKTSLLEQEKSVKEILAVIKFVANNVFHDMESGGETLSLEQMIYYIEQANWSSLLVKDVTSPLFRDLELTKETLIKNEELSTMFVHTLFENELEVELLTPQNKLTLNDLSLVFTKLITPLEMFQRVLKVLCFKHNPSETCHHLVEFCIKCLQNGLGLDFYPDPQIKSLIFEIGSNAPQSMSKALLEAYDQTAIHAFAKKQAAELALEQVKEMALIKPLNSHEVYQTVKFARINKLDEQEGLQIAAWHKSIELGHWKPEMASTYAKSIVKKTAAEFIKVPLDELLSGKLLKVEFCPKYNHLSDSLDCLSYLVAMDILSSHTKKGRANVMTFYIEVIKECLLLGDFASAFSLKMGLDLTPISRLKKTWDTMPKDVLQQFDIYNELFDPSNNSKNLKFKMNTCISDYFIEPPYLFGKNVVGYEEIPDRDAHGLINQLKFRRLSRTVIFPFQRIQRRLLDVKILKTNSLFDRKFETMELYKSEENGLYSLSYSREPKDKLS